MDDTKRALEAAEASLNTSRKRRLKRDLQASIEEQPRNRHERRRQAKLDRIARKRERKRGAVQGRPEVTP